jgi:hypothetical protein
MLILRKISTTNQGLIINKESCGSRRWRKRDHSHRNPLRFGRATTFRNLTVSLPWSSGVYLAKGHISDYILSLPPLRSRVVYYRRYLPSNFHPIKVKTHRARPGVKDSAPRGMITRLHRQTHYEIDVVSLSSMIAAPATKRTSQGARKTVGNSLRYRRNQQ